MTGTLTSLFYM